MATRSTSTSTSRSNGSTRQSSNTNRSRKSSKASQGSLALAIWAGLTSLYAGRVFLGLLLATLVIWIEALVLRKNYQLFFLTVGIEILIVLFIGWILYMIHGAKPEA